MLTRLYHEGELRLQQSVVLSELNSHRLARVLRAKAGMAVQLFNGDGNNYDGELTTVSNRKCEVVVEHCSPANTESPVHITLLQGLSRKDRMDACLQKSTELGVSRIVPVLCNRSKYKLDENRLQKKMQHWRQVIISACEQSGRSVLPELFEPTSLESALQSSLSGNGYFLHPDATASLAQQVVTNRGNDITIAIGPESGFDEQELLLAEIAGYHAASFGPRILRTETAGPAVIAAIQALCGDSG